MSSTRVPDPHPDRESDSPPVAMLTDAQAAFARFLGLALARRWREASLVSDRADSPERDRNTMQAEG